MNTPEEIAIIEAVRDNNIEELSLALEDAIAPIKFLIHQPYSYCVGGDTLLGYAIGRYSWEAANFIIDVRKEIGYDINQPNGYNAIPFISCICNFNNENYSKQDFEENYKIAKRMIDIGISLHIENGNGSDVLECCRAAEQESASYGGASHQLYDKRLTELVEKELAKEQIGE